MNGLLDFVRAEWEGAGGEDYYHGSDEDIALQMMGTVYAIFRIDPTVSEATRCVSIVRSEGEKR